MFQKLSVCGELWATTPEHPIHGGTSDRKRAPSIAKPQPICAGRSAFKPYCSGEETQMYIFLKTFTYIITPERSRGYNKT